MKSKESEGKTLKLDKKMAGQASPSSPYYPRRRDHQLLGLHQVMNNKNSEMLRQVLLWGTPRRQFYQPFSEYLCMAKGMRRSELHRRFNRSQLNKMDNDPLMNSFDVPLIYQCLIFGTDGLAPPNDERWIKSDTLEGRLTSARNYRNAIVHNEYEITDQVYLDKIEDIRDLLSNIIHDAAHQFGRSQAGVRSILKDFNEDLDKIRDLPDSPYGRRHKDYHIVGLHQVMNDKNGEMLRQVLLWGTPMRQSDQPLSEYLCMTKGMRRSKLRKIFTRSQLNKMDNDPLMNSFDVPLIYQCLIFGTDGLAPPNDERWIKSDTLEGRLTSARNYRNAIVHNEYKITDKLYIHKIEEIRELHTKIIHEAANRFGRSQAEITSLLKDFNEDLDKIKNLPESGERLFFEQLCTLFKIKGRIELEEKYKSLTSTSPASNLLGKEVQVEVTQIFTKLEIERLNSIELLELERLFVYIDLLSSTKNVLLVEGVAGVGKTTLMRLILQEWSNRSSKMKNLNQYGLAIWTECRDSGTQSLTHLLHSLMPKVTKKISGDVEVVECIQNNELLFIVDDIDELNASSERVFREILDLENTDIITIICTTRPNKVPDIKRYVPDTFKIQHVKITGIAEQDREEFVRSCSQALKSHVGTIDTPGLLNFLKRNENRLQGHWRLPFNLEMVTILWSIQPNIVNEITTATELFMRTYELCKERLIQRLHHDNGESCRLSSNDIRESLNSFIKMMANVAFISHCNNKTVLSRTSLHCLKEACDQKFLPPEKIMSSFLVQTRESPDSIDKNLEKYSFPSKGLQDFFCALHIEKALECKDTNLDIPPISSIEEVHAEDKVSKAGIPYPLQKLNSKVQEEASNTSPSVRRVLTEALKDVAIRNQNQDVQLDLSKWRNILLHLTGLLYHRGRSLTDERAAEMVELLQESGMADSNEWFDFLSNVKCDTTISRHIVLKGDLKVTDAQTEAFLKVMDHAALDTVEIKIQGDPSATPGLKEVLGALREKEWKVRLLLNYDFRFPKEGAIDGVLREPLRSNLRLTWFHGQLSASALKELPSSVDYLWLSVKDGAHFQSVLPVLTSRPTSLFFHVPVDIAESSLEPLPRVRELQLYVSGVSEATAKKASAIAEALQPIGGRYTYLIFPGVGERPRACEILLEELARRTLEVDHLFLGVAVTPFMDVEEELRLKDLARSNLKCGFFTESEDNIWMWLP